MSYVELKENVGFYKKYFKSINILSFSTNFEGNQINFGFLKFLKIHSI